MVMNKILENKMQFILENFVDTLSVKLKEKTALSYLRTEVSDKLVYCMMNPQLLIYLYLLKK